MPDVLRSSVQVRSISRSVWEKLNKADPPLITGTVSAVFQRACLLAFPLYEPVVVVLPEIGDGPLNIVVDGKPGSFPAAGASVQIDHAEGWLQIGGLRVVLDGATVWEPRPDWDRLRTRAAAILDRIPYLATLVLTLSPQDSFASFLRGAPPELGTADQMDTLEGARGRNHALLRAVSEAGRLLTLGWDGPTASLRIAASRLGGLGCGLTPAGDDFLLGVMIWAWLAHRAPDRICRPLLEGAQLRTTTLSAALLKAAGRGECGAPWHHLLGVLSEGADGELAAAVRAVLRYGHTSGADALAGFSWIGLSSARM